MSNRFDANYYANLNNTQYKNPEYKEYNSNQYNQNMYNTVFEKVSNSPFSVSQEPDIEYERKTHHIFVTSKNRNTNLHPNISSYSVEFPQEFKNIHSIELIQGIIPNVNNVTQEPYLLLKLEEIKDVVVSNDPDISESFAFLTMASPCTSDGYFIALDKKIHENTPKVYNTPKASLQKLTISVTKHDGTLFNFGTDSSPPNKSLQHTFVFKIVTLEKKRSVLSHRNIY
jgi:hypothetical protein